MMPEDERVALSRAIREEADYLESKVRELLAGRSFLPIGEVLALGAARANFRAAAVAMAGVTDFIAARHPVGVSPVNPNPTRPDA